jgi:hypothetical protein
MRSRQTTTEPSAVAAAAHLVEAALLEIRVMTANGEVFFAGDDADEQSPFETDVMARTHLLADVCHQLVPSLAEENPIGREALAADALANRWRVAVPAARRWMSSRLRQLGPAYEQLLG